MSSNPVEHKLLALAEVGNIWLEDDSEFTRTRTAKVTEDFGVDHEAALANNAQRIEEKLFARMSLEKVAQRTCVHDIEVRLEIEMGCKDAGAALGRQGADSLDVQPSMDQRVKHDQVRLQAPRLLDQGEARFSCNGKTRIFEHKEFEPGFSVIVRNGQKDLD